MRAQERARTSAPRTAITCASRSAKRSRTAASTPSRSAITARQRVEESRPALQDRADRAQRARCRAAVCTREFFAARRGYGCDSASRFSSSGCRAPARPCWSRFSPLTRRSKARPSCRIFCASWPSCRDAIRIPSEPALSRDPRAADRRGFPQARREIPRRYPRLSHRQAAIHRQDAEQLPAHRPHSPDTAECQDHRCAARADGVLLQQFQATVRIRPGIHVRASRISRATIAAMCELMRHWDEALPGKVLRDSARGCGGRPGRQRAAHSRLLRPAISSRHASSSTRPSAACAPRARSRCAGRSTRKGSISGGTSSRGWGSLRIGSRRSGPVGTATEDVRRQDIEPCSA